MTSQLDRSKILEKFNTLVNYSHISQFVHRQSIALMQRLLSELTLNCNAVQIEQKGYSTSCLIFVFKLNQADLTLTVDQKGFYFVKYYTFKPNDFKQYQFLTFEEDQMMRLIHGIFEMHRHSVESFHKSIEGYKSIGENNLVFTTFKEICNELQKCSEFVAQKNSKRFAINHYVENIYRNDYLKMKYSIAFKHDDQMIIVGIEDNVKVCAMMISLKYKNGVLVKYMENLTLKSIPTLINFISRNEYVLEIPELQ